jgi:hypothetical protein
VRASTRTAARRRRAFGTASTDGGSRPPNRSAWTTPVGAIRYAIRQCRLSPVFTASAALTLSLGIGGTTAIFTLIHAVMLRSLPVADPERLYRVGDGDNCCVSRADRRIAGACSRTRSSEEALITRLRGVLAGRTDTSH